jgi:hypothetical protein
MVRSDTDLDGIVDGVQLVANERWNVDGVRRLRRHSRRRLGGDRAGWFLR